MGEQAADAASNCVMQGGGFACGSVSCLNPASYGIFIKLQLNKSSFRNQPRMLREAEKVCMHLNNLPQRPAALYKILSYLHLNAVRKEVKISFFSPCWFFWGVTASSKAKSEPAAQKC